MIKILSLNFELKEVTNFCYFKSGQVFVTVTKHFLKVFRPFTSAHSTLPKMVHGLARSSLTRVVYYEAKSKCLL